MVRYVTTFTLLDQLTVISHITLPHYLNCYKKKTSQSLLALKVTCGDINENRYSTYCNIIICTLKYHVCYKIRNNRHKRNDHFFLFFFKTAPKGLLIFIQ